MVKTGQVWIGSLVTRDATGALATPSVGPAGVLYVDGVADAASVTISGTNPYKWSVTLPALTAGQSVEMYITATIAGIETAAFVAHDIGDTKRVSDLADLDAAGTRSALGMAAANLDNQIDALPTATEAASATRSELATELARIDVATSTRLATADYTAPPAVGAIADAIADEPLAGHTTPGTAAAAWSAAGAAGDPWASDLVNGDYNDPDTAGYIIARLAGIDVSAVTHVAASNAGHLTITRTLSFSATVSNLAIPNYWTACYWTVKRSTDDPDADAVIQILVSNPGDAEDGVQVLAGEAVSDGADGSLVVNQALGTVTIALGDASTALLDDAVELVWDIKVHTATGKTQPGAGTATITTAVTRA